MATPPLSLPLLVLGQGVSAGPAPDPLPEEANPEETGPIMLRSFDLYGTYDLQPPTAKVLRGGKGVMGRAALSLCTDNPGAGRFCSPYTFDIIGGTREYPGPSFDVGGGLKPTEISVKVIGLGVGVDPLGATDPDASRFLFKRLSTTVSAFAALEVYDSEVGSGRRLETGVNFQGNVHFWKMALKVRGGPRYTFDLTMPEAFQAAPESLPKVGFDLEFGLAYEHPVTQLDNSGVSDRIAGSSLHFLSELLAYSLTNVGLDIYSVPSQRAASAGLAAAAGIASLPATVVEARNLHRQSTAGGSEIPVELMGHIALRVLGTALCAGGAFAGRSDDAGQLHTVCFAMSASGLPNALTAGATRAVSEYQGRPIDWYQKNQRWIAPATHLLSVVAGAALLLAPGSPGPTPEDLRATPSAPPGSGNSGGDLRPLGFALITAGGSGVAGSALDSIGRLAAGWFASP